MGGFFMPEVGVNEGMVKFFEPDNQSLLSVQPMSLQVSAIKKAHDGDGIVVRLYNPGQNNVQANLTFARKPILASLVNLNETMQDKLSIDKNGNVRFTAGPCKIITIMCKF